MTDQQPSEVFTAVENYIRERTEWDVFVLPGGTGHMMSIMKGIPAGCMNKESDEEIELPDNLKGEELDLMEPSSEEFIQSINDLWNLLGKKYPMFLMGSTDNEPLVSPTTLTVHFNQAIRLDYADPRFFIQLDQVIAHVLTHDDLSQLSLQP